MRTETSRSSHQRIEGSRCQTRPVQVLSAVTRMFCSGCGAPVAHKSAVFGDSMAVREYEIVSLVLLVRLYRIERRLTSQRPVFSTSTRFPSRPSCSSRTVGSLFRPLPMPSRRRPCSKIESSGYGCLPSSCMGGEQARRCTCHVRPSKRVSS